MLLLQQFPCLLAWSRGVAWWNIERWVLQEKIPWSEKERHWLGGHDWEIFRGRKVRDTKSMPQDHVCVLDALVAMLSNPLREALRRLTGGLRDVSTSWVDLVVLICTSNE